MKRFYHCFALLTALSALLAALTVAACADYSDPVDMGLVFSPVTRLVAYVDGEWNADLSGSYGFGDTAAVTAPDVGGKSFSHWEADGSVISYAKSLKLTMNAHTTLSAVYADAAPTAKPVAGITSVTRTSDGGSISFQAIASGETAGIVYSTTATGDALVVGGSGVENAAAEKLTDQTTTLPRSVMDGNNCWMLKVTPDDASTVYHARAYVSVDSQTTYGDEKSVKLSELKSGITLVADPGGLDPNSSLSVSGLADKIRTITFDANGGDGKPVAQVFLPGKATKLTTNTFTRDGYAFDGWKTQPDGGASYVDGASVTFTADVTLYAQWKANSGGNNNHSSSDGGSSAPVEQNKTGFVDVPTGSFYEDAVAWAVEAGVTTGTDATHFSPNAVCTRAQTVTFLWRAAGSPEPTTTTTFTDVPANDYYTKAVQWAAENGITTGTSATTFSPFDPVDRAQTVTFLYRALKGTANGDNPFADVADSAYYADAVRWAVAEGVTTGTSATSFSPNDNCLRAQIVTFLYRAFEGK